MKALFSPIALILVAFGAHAAPMCQLGTLADYVALGSTGCIINDKLFANFLALHTASGGAVPATNESIAVAPIIQTGPAIRNPGPGLLFSTGDWTAFAGQTVNTSIRFTVTVLDPLYLLGNASLAFAGAATGAQGSASVSETILPSGASLFVADLPGSASDVFQDAVVYAPVRSITVLKDIQAKAGANSFAKISFLQQEFSQVVIPEPATLGLTAVVLLALGYRRR